MSEKKRSLEQKVFQIQIQLPFGRVMVAIPDTKIPESGVLRQHFDSHENDEPYIVPRLFASKMDPNILALMIRNMDSGNTIVSCPNKVRFLFRNQYVMAMRTIDHFGFPEDLGKLFRVNMFHTHCFTYHMHDEPTCCGILYANVYETFLGNMSLAITFKISDQIHCICGMYHYDEYDTNKVKIIFRIKDKLEGVIWVTLHNHSLPILDLHVNTKICQSESCTSLIDQNSGNSGMHMEARMRADLNLSRY